MIEPNVSLAQVGVYIIGRALAFIYASKVSAHLLGFPILDRLIRVSGISDVAVSKI